MSIFAMTLAFMMFSSNALAYDWTVDAYDDDGNYIVDNYKARGNSVTLYLYVDQSNRDCMNNKGHFITTCINEELGGPIEGPIEDYRFDYLKYEWYVENKEVYTTLDGGEVWVFEFSLEDGVYFLSDPFGSESPLNQPRIYILDQNFKFPVYPDGYDPRTDRYYGDEWVLDGSSPTHLYGIYGSKEFREEYCAGFEAWAEEHEKAYLENKTDTNVESTETIEVEAVATATPEADNSDETVVETTPEPEPTELPIDNSELPIEITPEPEEENNSFPIGAVVAGIGVIAIGGVGMFVFMKRK